MKSKSYLWKGILGSVLIAVGAYLCLASYDIYSGSGSFSFFSHDEPVTYVNSRIELVKFIPGIFLLIVGEILLLRGIQEYSNKKQG